MKHGIIQLGLPLAGALIGILTMGTGCGGSDDGGSSSAGSAGSTGCADCRTPPPPPEDGVLGDGPGTVFTITNLYLGDKLRDGSKDPNAWKQFGYDLDGIKSTKETTNHCQPVEGATDASVKTDGEGGIDNSFGANLLPILEGYVPDLAALNESMVEGKYAILLEVEDLGGGKDYLGLPAAMYFGRDLGAPPAWDGSDVWPLYCELLDDCQPSGTKQLADGNESVVRFPWSYVANGTWVSGSETTASISLNLQGIPIRLDIGQAIMAFDLDGASPPTGGTNGVIAGIIGTTHLIGTLAQLAGRLSSSLCDPATLESIKRSLKAASDIMVDGTQDPNAACDGISVGFGFEMKSAQLGEVQNAQELKPDPCEEP